jgi:hypothetical protein
MALNQKKWKLRRKSRTVLNMDRVHQGSSLSTASRRVLRSSAATLSQSLSLAVGMKVMEQEDRV